MHVVRTTHEAITMHVFIAMHVGRIINVVITMHVDRTMYVVITKHLVIILCYGSEHTFLCISSQDMIRH